MSLATVFNAIKAQVQAKIANATPFNQGVNSNNTIQYVQMWNNQLKSWRDSYKQVKDDEMVTGNDNTYIPAMPAILVEFVNPLKPKELGAGVQIYDDLNIAIHIVHQQLDAGDGTMEQNLEVYALAQQVYAALNKFRPAGCGEFIREDEMLDPNHDNLYHYVIVFGTTYIDNTQLEPVGGVPATIKTVEIDVLVGNNVLTDEDNNPVVDENNNEIAI
jgi:hypothetical protein